MWMVVPSALDEMATSSMCASMIERPHPRLWTAPRDCRLERASERSKPLPWSLIQMSMRELPSPSEVPVCTLVPCGWDVYQVGDCVAPLGIAEALQAARLVVTQLSQ